MAIRIEVCKVASDSYRASGSQGSEGKRQTTQNFTQTFLVKAVKNKRGELYDGNPDEISPASIGCNSLLPIVNKTAFYDPSSGVMHPYALCTSKDIKRRSDNPFLFDVTCNYSTQPGDTEDCSVMVKYVSAPQDLSPQVTVGVSGKDQVLYEDYDGNNCWKFDGIDEEYPTPVITQRPFLTLNIQQYEYSVSYQDILDRSFKVNSDAWGGFGAEDWRVNVVNVSEIDVQTLAGPQTWAKATYQVILGNYGYFDLSNNWVDIGWDQAIPRIATKYVELDGGGNPDPDRVLYFTHGGTSVRRVGNINADGTKSSNQDRHGYNRHRRYGSVNFSTFLRNF